MISRIGGGWQTAMADLALILFLVVAAAHRDEPVQAARAGEGSPAGETARAGAIERTRATDHVELGLGQPMAVFREGGGGDLSQWLAEQPIDAAQVATVVVRHRPGDTAQAAREGTRLTAQIERGGARARLVVEPAVSPETLVVIAHDARAGMEIASD